MEGIPNDSVFPLPFIAWNTKFVVGSFIILGTAVAYIIEGFSIFISKSTSWISLGTFKSFQPFFVDSKFVTTFLKPSSLIPFIKS
jgi:hypothetical protein